MSDFTYKLQSMAIAFQASVKVFSLLNLVLETGFVLELLRSFAIQLTWWILHHIPFNASPIVSLVISAQQREVFLVV